MFYSAFAVLDYLIFCCCYSFASVAEVLERKQLFSMAAFFRAFLDSPVGPKTTHFWGPVANWGFVAAVFFFTIIFFSSFDHTDVPFI